MDFLKLPTEIRLMVYKECKPRRLHFPITSVQDGLQFLAVCRTTRSELLPSLQKPTAVNFHHLTKSTLQAFYHWSADQEHVTELSLTAKFHNSLRTDKAAFCKVTYYFETTSSGLLSYTLDQPSDSDSAIIYDTRLVDLERKMKLWFTYGDSDKYPGWHMMDKIVSTLNDQRMKRIGDTLQPENELSAMKTLNRTEIETIVQMAQAFTEEGFISEKRVREACRYEAEHGRQEEVTREGGRIRHTEALRYMTWGEWKADLTPCFYEINEDGEQRPMGWRRSSSNDGTETLNIHSSEPLDQELVEIGEEGGTALFRVDHLPRGLRKELWYCLVRDIETKLVIDRT